MHARSALIVVLSSAGMLAQSAPPACPAGRPVDELIAEIHKQQSHKKHRNTNPVPDAICVFGWCHDRSSARTPPTLPEPAQQAKTPGSTESSSSSSVPEDKCNQAMEMALKAAHDVEVGDYSFETKNYAGALQRYQDAAQEKPDDSAILVRQGRAFEKLGQAPQAIEQYKTAQDLPGPARWSDEARAALVRLQKR